MNSREFIKLLDEYEINVFDEKTIENQAGVCYAEWKNTTRSLLKNGIIYILEKGKYVRHNFADEKVIGSFIVNKGTLAYWSALHFHGYTTQIPNTIFIQSSQRKISKQILGVNYQFIYVHPTQHIGIVKEGFGNNIFYHTDIEKTILDCLHKPELSGELPELINAIAKAPLDENKLILYAKAIGNKAIVQRLALYLEVAERSEFNLFFDFARQFKSKGYTLLDPTGLDIGRYTTKWNIRINIDIDNIQMIMQN